MKKMIGTLTSSSSSTKIINLEDFPPGIIRGGKEIFPTFHRKTFHLKLLRLDSVHSKILRPILLRSSSIQVSQVDVEAVEIEDVEKSPTKTVRVRFQLRKECVFGEHFFILGDDPAFGGLWDPENALPLIWSDGHVWTIDLDLPVGRLVEFKFILKAKTGEILWQPGPNRALETWETNKTIRLCEDWENADLQMMIEEDFVPVNQEERQSTVNLDMLNNNGAEEEAEVLGTVKQNSSVVVVVENAGYVSDESAENWSYDVQTMESSNGALTARETNVTEEAMFTEEEGSVLVPGLIPLSDSETKEVPVEVINEGKAETFPEINKMKETKGDRNEKGKVKAVSLFEKSEREAVKGVEKRNYNAAEEEQRLETEAVGQPHVILEKDIQWGRRTLYKLLSNFGLF